MVVGLAVLLLLIFRGESIRGSAEEMQPGIERDVVEAVGKPTGWVADRLPFDEWGDDALSWLSEDEELAAGPGFEDAGEEPGVPVQGSESARPKRNLRSLLATGDSLVNPLDLELARRLADDGVKVERDPRIGTGISKSGFVDWGKLSQTQAQKFKPDAVVVFIGANEGFSLKRPDGKQVDCCGPDWAAVYAGRARRLMDTYRQGGAARVYWLEVPLPRARLRQKVQRTVNAAFEVAAQPWRSQVRLLDLTTVFTPKGRYRDAMKVDGRNQIVREPDGNHLNRKGAEVAADLVLKAVRRDFGG